jgi:MSHA biogenesis protein MshJ
MKKYWKKIGARIDARTLRERAILFGGAAAAIIFLVFSLVLNPSYAQQRLMLDEMARQQDRIAGVEAEIAQTIVAHTVDPDAAERARLAKIRADVEVLTTSLTAMQQGMVPPERMTILLEQILRAHRGLRLKSVRTLGDPGPLPAPVAGVPATGQLLKTHGVELVVQGSYHDMVAYMSALESMQGQLFWGSATMKVDTYPNATLTLVAYTINLDKKWMKL